MMLVSLTEEIREYALDLGFDGIGFATADPFTGLSQALQERKEGYSWTDKTLQLSQRLSPALCCPKLVPWWYCSMIITSSPFPQRFWAK